jgi:hypothetical protein
MAAALTREVEASLENVDNLLFASTVIVEKEGAASSELGAMLDHFVGRETCCVGF